jgi:hypothetical protein
MPIPASALIGKSIALLLIKKNIRTVTYSTTALRLTGLTDLVKIVGVPVNREERVY